MPLILAIEPDKRQASLLTGMVRGRLHAELVIADTAEQALASLGDRIPDLILTAALLSPKDESALDERLRSLNGVAAHVQTLTIPVLSRPGRDESSRAGGVLSVLLGDKSKTAAHEGCDPAVFAEQCKEYLDRAASERLGYGNDDPAPLVTEPVAKRAQPVVEAIAVVKSPAVVKPGSVLKPESVVKPEPIVKAEPVLKLDSVIKSDSVIASDSTIKSESVVKSHAPSVVKPQPSVKAEPARQKMAAKAGKQLDEPPACLVEALALFEAEEQAPAAPPAKPAPVERREVAIPHVAFAPIALAQLKCWPRIEGMAVEERNEPKEWLDIIEALRRDASQMPAHGQSADAPAPPASHEPARRKRRPRTPPIQDEWGFFDPDQCGFQALIAKLEEITEQEAARTLPQMGAASGRAR